MDKLHKFKTIISFFLGGAITLILGFYSSLFLSQSLFFNTNLQNAVIFLEIKKAIDSNDIKSAKDMTNAAINERILILKFMNKRDAKFSIHSIDELITEG